MSLYSEQHLRNYVVKERIASGGMGEIWRAWDVNRGCFVAIKTITDDLFYDSNFAKRFVDEGRHHSKLNHPNIVPIVDVFNENNQSCLVMELIEGMSLADLLDSRPNKQLGVAEAIPIIKDLLIALNYAHQRGIIHRDVKPSNVLLDKTGKGYLIDFGIALAIGESRRTRTGQTIGTPLYMSPEQITSPRDIDHRTDVYSVGCVFYEILTGRPPFIADNMNTGDYDFAIKEAHIKKPPIPPKEIVNIIPTFINDIILFCLQKKPENRLPGCQEFIRMLNEGDSKKSDVGIIKKLVGITLRWEFVAGVILIIVWIILITLIFIQP